MTSYTSEQQKNILQIQQFIAANNISGLRKFIKENQPQEVTSAIEAVEKLTLPSAYF